MTIGHTEQDDHSIPFVGVFMMLSLVVCFIISLSTFLLKNQEFDVEPESVSEFWNGKYVGAIEDKFEKEIVGRDQFIGIWGLIQYGILKSGGEKAIVGKDGWLFTTEEFKTLERAKQAETRFFFLLSSINEFLKDNDIELVVALVPAKARIYEEYLGQHKFPDDKRSVYNRVLNMTNEIGVKVPDLVQLFQQEKNDTLLYFPLDTHWTPDGASIVAQAMAYASQGVTLKQTLYTQVESYEDALEGDLEKYINSVYFRSFFGPQRDKIKHYKVTKQSTDDAVGLFDNESIPVALVGTSYSAIEKWNFEGALKTALQADVLNVAEEGKGPLAAMADFLEETDFDDKTIKLVIWEIPERFVSVSYDKVTFPGFIERDK